MTLHSLSDSAKVYFVSNMNYAMKIKGVKQLKANKNPDTKRHRSEGAKEGKSKV